MNQFLLIVMLIILGSNSIVAQEITFKRQDPKPGDVRTSTTKTNMSMQITAAMYNVEMGKFHRYSSSIQKKKELVLLTSNSQIIKMKTTYIQDDKIETEDINKKETILKPTSGKTYIIELKDENLLISYIDGSLPSDGEVEIIKKDYKDFGKPDKIVKELDGKTLSIGQKVPFLEDSLRTAMGDSFNSNDIKKVDVTLKGQKECGSFTCAIFDLDMILSTKIEEEAVMELKLSGEILAAMNTWPVKIQLKGPLTISGQSQSEGQTIQMKGSGSTDLFIEFVYTK